MLLDFTVSNYQCFTESAQLSFVRPSLRTQTPKAPQTWEDVTYRVAALYGANASGKSTLLTALARLGAAVAEPGTPLYRPHAAVSPEHPTVYEANFVTDDVRYRYVVEAVPWGVRSESLIAYPKGVRRLLFAREQHDPDAEMEMRVGASVKGPTAEVRRILTPGDLMLAVAARYRHTTLQPIARGLRRGAALLPIRRENDNEQQRLQWVMSRMVEAPAGWKEIIDALAAVADLGIAGVEVQEQQVPPNVLARIRAMLAAAVDEPGEIPGDAVDPIVRSLVFTHVGIDGEKFELGLGAQSDGTITWLATAAPAVDVLARGALLIIDELDASLHPVLAAALVTMFKDPDINRTGAQILFSTHDTSLMGNHPERCLEAGEIWFTEKGQDGASELYSLADFDSRPGNNEQKRYLAGRFGALPTLDLSKLFDLPEVLAASTGVAE